MHVKDLSTLSYRHGSWSVVTLISQEKTNFAMP
jgi:hypothetical protein